MKASFRAEKKFIKLLALGDAKTGKTGSIVSLISAGYIVCLIDMDNLSDILINRINQICPDKLDNLHIISIRDEYKSGLAGRVIKGKPTAWVDAVKLLDHWKDDEEDLGIPSEWGGDYILVIDGLSRLCDAAYDFHDFITPKGKDTGKSDGRAVYGSAQDAVEKLLAMLTSDDFGTNVLMVCHGTYMTLEDQTMRIFPQGVGQKLSPRIPTYFPNYVQYVNQGEKRTISLKSTNMINLSTTKPGAIPDTLPIETGLATIFAALRDPPKNDKPSLKRIA